MSDANIADLIKILSEKGDETYSKVCKVVAVNDTFCDVEPINGDAPISDVKLVGSKTETPFILVPKVDSVVVVTYTSKSTAYVALVSEIESVKIRGDQYGGLIKIEELVDKINRIEDAFNSLVNTFNTHIHTTTATVGASAVVGVIAPTTTQETTITPKTKKSDLENDKVKHG